MQIHVSLVVKKFILSLQSEARAKVARTIDLLEEFGYQLRMPQSKKLGVGIFELRVHGRQEVRIFYCFYHDSIYLLSGFIKKSQKTPIKELAKAKNKLDTLISKGSLDKV